MKFSRERLAMSSLDSFLIEAWSRWLQLRDDPIDLPFYLGAGSRLLLTLCFLAYFRVTGDQRAERPPRRFWIALVAKEAALVLLAMLALPVAIFVCVYSILKAREYLALGNQTAESQVMRGGALCLVPGFLLAGVAVVVGYFVAGDATLVDLLVVPAAGALFWAFNRRWSRVLPARGQARHAAETIWAVLPRYGKVALVLGLVLPPVVLSGLVYARLFAFSREYDVAMSDGTRLKTYVYFPPGHVHGQRHPVVLYRTPYDAGRDQLVGGYVREYTTRGGCVVVMQDIRGTHESGGAFYYFRNDSADGTETVAWVTRQPWSDGYVATVGGSADATNQYYYHAEGPSGLGTAHLLMGSPELYAHWFFPGGCFRREFGTLWMTMVGAEDQIPVMLDHAAFDETWAPVSVARGGRAANLDLRAVHVGGWYDCFQQGTLDGFTYYNSHGTARARDHQVLIMGPWAHSFTPGHPDVTYPETQGANLSNYYKQLLFDESLRGVSVDWSAVPRVHYYVMGDPGAPGSGEVFNAWRTAPDWPIPGLSVQQWHLHANGTLARGTPTGLGARSYLFDPTDPVTTRGGTSLFVGELGGCDQRPVEAGRVDVLGFVSEPLTAPVEVCGRVNATLHVSSNCTDTDFHVKLLDVFPDGREMWVAAGILKTRYRDGFRPEHVALMTPGQVYAITVDMWSTAYRFVPGHRLKVSVTSSNAPKFAVNPNTGGPVGDAFTRYAVANNTVWAGPGALSRLALPCTTALPAA